MDAHRSRPSGWLVFCGILGGAIATAIVLIPHLGVPATIVLVQVAAVLAIVVAEWRLPHRVGWLRSHGDVRTDLGHALVSGLGVTRLAEATVRAVGVVLAARIATSMGGSIWPTSWPLAAQLALALPIAELPQYWLHRLQHEHDWLWRFHAVHHSAPRLYWLNAGRFHPVDIGLLYIVGYLPLVVLGCPEEVIGLFALFDAVFGMLQHSNIEMHLGPLNRVFSAAEPHRWHHSRVLGEANTNYGSNLLVWDLVFGTFFLPANREPPADIGIADLPAFPTGYLAQLASPFRWRRVKREAAASHGAGARDRRAAASAA
jgi:sterol desaturase/sphingolipid hydroxylase (fatty acid hydroxylase superfamily)